MTTTTMTTTAKRRTPTQKQIEQLQQMPTADLLTMATSVVSALRDRASKLSSCRARQGSRTRQEEADQIGYLVDAFVVAAEAAGIGSTVEKQREDVNGDLLFEFDCPCGKSWIASELAMGECFRCRSYDAVESPLCDQWFEFQGRSLAGPRPRLTVAAQLEYIRIVRQRLTADRTGVDEHLAMCGARSVLES